MYWFCVIAVLQDYLIPIQNKEVSIPAELEGEEMIIFGNVHQIYDWHKEYVCLLQQCRWLEIVVFSAFSDI